MLPSYLFHTFGVSSCAPTTFFGIPAWYTYLYKAGYVTIDTASNSCNFNFDLTSGGHLSFGPFMLIGLGILDILLRVAGLIAVGYVVYGGIQYVTSQGEPDKTKKAQGTIINALVGLTITVVAAAVIGFIGDRLGS